MAQANRYSVAYTRNQREVISYDPPGQFVKLVVDLAHLVDENGTSPVQIWKEEDGYWVPLYPVKEEQKTLMPIPIRSREVDLEGNREAFKQVGSNVCHYYRYGSKKARLNAEVASRELDQIRQRLSMIDSVVQLLSEEFQVYFHLSVRQELGTTAISMRTHVSTATVSREVRKLRLELGYEATRLFPKEELDEMLAEVTLLKLHRR